MNAIPGIKKKVRLNIFLKSKKQEFLKIDWNAGGGDRGSIQEIQLTEVIKQRTAEKESLKKHKGMPQSKTKQYRFVSLLFFLVVLWSEPRPLHKTGLLLLS